ncbi:hypothetical protein TWF281_006215 [Arthrobotrys megalospora]
MRDFIRNHRPGPSQEYLLPGISAMFNFFSEFEKYRDQIERVEKISEDIRRWRKSEERVDRSVLAPEANHFLHALRNYAMAVREYPDFAKIMSMVVGSFAAVSEGGRYNYMDPDVTMKLIFMDIAPTAQELNDEWLAFLIEFLGGVATKLRRWVTRVETAMGVYGPIILELKSQAVSSEDFEKVQADLRELSQWSAVLANDAEEASIMLGQFLQAIPDHDWLEPELEYHTPGTLPYTPGQEPPRWYDSPGEGGDGGKGDVFYRIENEPLTPPSNFQGDDRDLTAMAEEPVTSPEIIKGSDV